MERKELLMVVMVGVLLVTTAMQTMALANLGSGQVVVPKPSVSSNPAPSSSGSPHSAPDLSSLPSMVGGC